MSILAQGSLNPKPLTLNVEEKMEQDFSFDPSTVLLPGLQDRPIDAPGGTFHLPTTTFGDPRAFRWRSR